MLVGRSIVALAVVGLAVAARAEPAPPADVGRGRALFIGERRLEKGGAPCGACHAVAGEGLAFTASLGPELSATVGGMDADGLDALLESLPFPTMAPVYDGRPLTPAERADLAAYLVAAAKRGAPEGAWRFHAWGAGVAALLFLAIALAARRRKGSARARLLAGAARLERVGGRR